MAPDVTKYFYYAESKEVIFVMVSSTAFSFLSLGEDNGASLQHLCFVV